MFWELNVFLETTISLHVVVVVVTSLALSFRSHQAFQPLGLNLRGRVTQHSVLASCVSNCRVAGAYSASSEALSILPELKAKIV